MGERVYNAFLGGIFGAVIGLIMAGVIYWLLLSFFWIPIVVCASVSALISFLSERITERLFYACAGAIFGAVISAD